MDCPTIGVCWTIQYLLYDRRDDPYSIVVFIVVMLYLNLTWGYYNFLD